MSLFDLLKSELIDIVEWIDDTNRTLVWRFPRHDNEIKNGAQLIVRPGQMAILVSEGKLADVYEPGHYELSTKNMPILSTLQGWKYGFASPFKVEVYFVRTTQVTDLKWGTPNPLMLRDPEFGPIRIRAFGSYALRAIDPAALLREIVGTNGEFDAEDVTELLRSMIQSSFASLLGSSQIAALDLAGHYVEMSEQLRRYVNEQIDDEYGLECPQLMIVNMTFPEAVEKALDTRTSMGVIGDMNRYQQYQMGNAMTAAAENPSGGGAAEGMGLGVGMAMAGRMMPGFAGGFGAAGGQAPGHASPPPLPSLWHVAVNGVSSGPFSMEQVVSQIASGQFKPETMVWTTGMPSWAAASTVPALANYFKATTPPPPPPPASS